MEAIISNNHDIDSEQLADFSKALRDYQTTGTKQCLSILSILMESNISINQLKESKIGACLSKIAKDESEDPEEKALKKAAVQLFKKCKHREDKPSQGEIHKTELKKSESSPHVSTESKRLEKEEILLSPEDRKLSFSRKSSTISMNEESKISLSRRSSVISAHEGKLSPSDVFKPFDSALQRRISTDDSRKEPLREVSGYKKNTHKSSGHRLEVEKLPPVTQEYRNFALKAFTDGLLIDYKGNPHEKEKWKPIASEKAIEIERALSEKTRGNDNGYRYEARNLSNFLMLKNNEELRRRLMDGTAECREFVDNKENFLNQTARDRIEEASRRIIDASNADYDKKIIRESQLYQCRRCKSRKISKTEKQTRGGDEPMTSFFNCAECGNGWKE
jgi:DNA-directed RNA polymerase subunit M/transcription elongation factor TFIIS